MEWGVSALVVIAVLKFGSDLLLKRRQSWNGADEQKIDAADVGPETQKCTADNPRHPRYLAALKKKILSPGENIQAVFDCIHPQLRESYLDSGTSYLDLMAITTKRVVHYNGEHVKSISLKTIRSAYLEEIYPHSYRGNESTYKLLNIDTLSGPYDFTLYQGDAMRAHDLMTSRAFRG